MSCRKVATSPSRPLLPLLRGISAGPLALLLVGCSGGGGGAEPSAAQGKLATDLVQCQNEKSALKEQLAEAQAQVKKLTEEMKAAVKDPSSAAQIAVSAKSGSVSERRGTEGNVSPDAVTKVFQQGVGGLRACYNKGLKRNPNLQYVSSVNANFAVKNSGNAINISFSPHADGEMEKCMASSIGRLHFPSFSGDPVQFSIAVNFAPK